MDASANRPGESPPESLADFLVAEKPGYLRRLIERQDGGETAGVVYRDGGELTQTEIAESDGSLIVSPSTPSVAEAPIPIHTHPPDSDARLSAQDYQAFVDRFVATPKPRVTPIQGVAVLYDNGDGTATVHAVSPTRSVFDVPLVERYQIGRQVQFLSRTIPPEQLPERLAGVIEVVDEVATESYATLQVGEREETPGLGRVFADPEDSDPEDDDSADSTTGVLDQIEDEIESLTETDPDPIETDPPESDTAGLESDRVGDAPPPMDVLPDVTSEELRRRPHSYRGFEPREFDTVIDREGVEAAREALGRVEAGRWEEMLKAVHDAYVPLDGERGKRSNERAQMWRRNPGLLHWVGVWARMNYLSDPRADKPDDVGYPFGGGE